MVRRRRIPWSVLSLADEEKLLAVAKPHVKALIIAALDTGMRRGEILSLRWLDVDLSQNRLYLPQTKNGEGRIVYLNEGARAVLSSMPCEPGVSIADKIFCDITPGQVSITSEG